MTNLDNILKSKDITFLTKVHLVKAIVFPVAMYRCDSCTIKKAEGQRIDAFELWCWRGLLKIPWTCKEIKPVNSQGNQPWIFIERTETDAEIPILWRPDVKNWLPGKDRDAGKDWGQEKRVAEMRWWDSNTDSMDMNLSKLQARARDRETFSVVVHGVAKSQTWLNDWTTTIYTVQKKKIRACLHHINLRINSLWE